MSGYSYGVIWLHSTNDVWIANNLINNLTSRGNKMQLANLNEEVTMSSLDFLNKVINPARKAAGESEVRNNVFI